MTDTRTQSRTVEVGVNMPGDQSIDRVSDRR